MDEDILNLLDDDYIPEGKSELYQETIKNTGICKECGNTFSQGYRINKKTKQKIFNEFKYCPKCRKKLDKKNQGTVKEVVVKYNPYPWQKEFHASRAKYKVVSGAARSGKDYSFDKEFIDKFVDMLNEDRPYSLIPRVHGWVVGPTYKILAQIERDFMANFPRTLVVNYDKESHVIETINGGLIEFRSADDPDSLVSVGLDIVYITEAARIKDFDIVIGNLTDRIESPGRGKNGTGGYILINSSPRGRTFFNEVCKWGISGGPKQRPDWQTWYISRWDNPTFAARRHKVFDDRIRKWVEKGDDPYLQNKRTYEEDLMMSRSDWQYQEDILGIPSDEAGTQFPNFRDKAVIEIGNNKTKQEVIAMKQDLKTPKPYYTYSIGFDPAKSVDASWVLIYCEQTGDVVEVVKLQHIKYTDQINNYIKPLVEKWNYAMVRYGKTGLGEALEDLFVMAGIAAEAYPEQGKNKEKLVENLTSLVNDGKFKIYNYNDLAEELIRQFEDYGYAISEKGKTITYSNMTANSHDDGVSAAYFAVADVRVNDISEAVNFYDNDNFFMIQNNNNDVKGSGSGFYD